MKAFRAKIKVMGGGMLLGVESCGQKVHECKLTRFDFFFLVSFCFFRRTRGREQLRYFKDQKVDVTEQKLKT